MTDLEGLKSFFHKMDTAQVVTAGSTLYLRHLGLLYYSNSFHSSSVTFLPSGHSCEECLLHTAKQQYTNTCIPRSEQNQQIMSHWLNVLLYKKYWDATLPGKCQCIAHRVLGIFSCTLIGTLLEKKQLKRVPDSLKFYRSLSNLYRSLIYSYRALFHAIKLIVFFLEKEDTALNYILIKKTTDFSIILQKQNFFCQASICLCKKDSLLILWVKFLPTEVKHFF